MYSVELFSRLILASIGKIEKKRFNQIFKKDNFYEAFVNSLTKRTNYFFKYEYIHYNLERILSNKYGCKHPHIRKLILSSIILVIGLVIDFICKILKQADGISTTSDSLTILGFLIAFIIWMLFIGKFHIYSAKNEVLVTDTKDVLQEYRKLSHELMQLSQYSLKQLYKLSRQKELLQEVLLQNGRYEGSYKEYIREEFSLDSLNNFQIDRTVYYNFLLNSLKKGDNQYIGTFEKTIGHKKYYLNQLGMYPFSSEFRKENNISNPFKLSVEDVKKIKTALNKLDEIVKKNNKLLNKSDITETDLKQINEDICYFCLVISSIIVIFEWNEKSGLLDSIFNAT